MTGKDTITVLKRTYQNILIHFYDKRKLFGKVHAISI